MISGVWEVDGARRAETLDEIFRRRGVKARNRSLTLGLNESIYHKQWLSQGSEFYTYSAN